jgi:hypothetical protein
MIRVSIVVYVEGDDEHQAVTKLRGAMEALDDMRYYEQGAVVDWDYSLAHVTPSVASGVRLERRRKDQEEAGEDEEDDSAS